MEIDNKSYQTRTVKILDAQANQELGDGDNPKFVQSLILILQEVETMAIFEVELSEEDVRQLIKAKDTLTSKQMIDLSILLKQREESIKILLPDNKKNLTFDDIMLSKTLDTPQKSNRSRKRRRRRKPAQNRT